MIYHSGLLVDKKIPHRWEDGRGLDRIRSV